MKKRTKLLFSAVSLLITFSALVMGVFSASIRSVTISGTISYEVKNVIVKIESSVINAFEDANNDKTLQPLGTKRDIIIQNFDPSWMMQPVFTLAPESPGTSDAFLEGKKWNVSSLYFNPNSSSPSYLDPTDGTIPPTSPTIALKTVIYNYSTVPIKVTVAVDSNSALKQIGSVVNSIPNPPYIGYDLSKANIASIQASNAQRTNVSYAESIIYLKLNVIDVDFSSLNFNFTITIEPA